MYAVITKTDNDKAAVVTSWDSASAALNHYLGASSSGREAWLVKQKMKNHGYVPGGKGGKCKKCGAGKQSAEHYLGKGKEGPFIKPMGKLDAKNSKKKGKVEKADGPDDDGPDDDDPDDDIQLVKAQTAIAESRTPKRYTLGPLYSPMAIDAHGDFIEPDDLQESVWNFVRKSDRTIRLQHNRDVVAGEVVEVVTWPFEVTQPLRLPDDVTKAKSLPPGTVFLGVIWEPFAWELVEKGKLRGYSMGGRAKRMEVDFG